jgi:hypothetical protein
VTARGINASQLDLGDVGAWTSALGNGSATTSGSDVIISVGLSEAAIFVAQ